jgi:hypothetical protein
MANLLSRLIDPWYPATALGLEKGIASVVQLERTRGSACKLRRAATFNIDESLVRPNFDEQNIPNGAQLAAVVKDLASSAGLLRQKRWSLSLPVAVSRRSTGSFALEDRAWLWRYARRAFDLQRPASERHAWA